MGYFRAHHKKKGKCEKSQISHIKPFFQVKHSKGVIKDSITGKELHYEDFVFSPDLPNNGSCK